MEEAGPLALPDEVTSPWVEAFANRLLRAATQPPNKFTQFVPIDVLTGILTRSEKLFRSEPTLLEVTGAGLHGQRGRPPAAAAGGPGLAQTPSTQPDTHRSIRMAHP